MITVIQAGSTGRFTSNLGKKKLSNRNTPPITVMGTLDRNSLIFFILTSLLDFVLLIRYNIYDSEQFV